MAKHTIDGMYEIDVPDDWPQASRVELPNAALSAYADAAIITMKSVGVTWASDPHLAVHAMTAMLVLAIRHPDAVRPWYDGMMAASRAAHEDGRCECGAPDTCVGVWGEMADRFAGVLPS